MKSVELENGSYVGIMSPWDIGLIMPDGSLEVVSSFDCVRVYRDEWLDFWVEVGDAPQLKLM